MSSNCVVHPSGTEGGGGPGGGANDIKKYIESPLRLHQVAPVEDVLQVTEMLSIKMESSRDRPSIECKSGVGEMRGLPWPSYRAFSHDCHWDSTTMLLVDRIFCSLPRT